MVARMHIIVISSQKGGSGKTTLCAHLAVEAERAGHGPVYLVDTDPQGTLTVWHEKRQAEVPQRVELPFPALAQGLELLRQRQAAYCFIDTAPSRSEDVTSLFPLADLVLVPIRPSPSDLWAAAATVDRLRAGKIPFLFVLTQVKARAGITGQAAAALSHHGPVAEAFIGDRIAYAASFTDGRTAAELTAASPAARETAALWTHVHAYLQARASQRDRTIHPNAIEPSHTIERVQEIARG